MLEQWFLQSSSQEEKMFALRAYRLITQKEKDVN